MNDLMETPCLAFGGRIAKTLLTFLFLASLSEQLLVTLDNRDIFRA